MCLIRAGSLHVDMNDDGHVNGHDLAGFVAALFGG